MRTHQLFKTQLQSVSVFVSMSVTFVIIFAFSTATKADTEAEEKAFMEATKNSLDTTFLGGKMKCQTLPTESELAKGSVYLKALNEAILSELTKLGVPSDIGDVVEQVRIRTRKGKQYFLVQHDSASYRCPVGAQLPVTMRHPIEPLTDIRMEINPCCTYTFGGDAQAQWFGIANCPLYKKKQVADTICGH